MTCEIKNTFDLSGKWKYILDPEMVLKISEVRKAYYANDPLPSMTIPCNWQKEGLNNFNGSVWFVKEISKTLDHTYPIILQFFGVDYFTRVYLNWYYLGSHEGYFQPFTFQINNRLIKNKVNILIVKVTSPLEEPGRVWPHKKKLVKGIFNHHDCRPGGWDLKNGQDQNTGGIWNKVQIEYGYELILKNVRVDSMINWTKNSAALIIQCDILNPSPKKHLSRINLLISENGTIKYRLKKDTFIRAGDNRIKFNLNIQNPRFWHSYDIGEPFLYKIKIFSDSFRTQKIDYGIRDVSIDKHQRFYLNKKRLFLRGTNIIPTQFLSELTSNKINRLANLLKEANVNIVRVHAHVNRRELYEEFDRVGILVWQDFSLQWTYDNSKKFVVNARSQIKDMVRVLYNHPSIAFWCCHNEPGEQIDMLDSILEEAVLDEDRSRIVRKASNYEEHPYDGWYWGNKEHFAAVPMGPLITEFGAQAIPSMQSLKKFMSPEKIHNPDWESWKYHNFQYEQTFNIAEISRGKSVKDFIKNSQDYQAELITTAINFYRRKRFDGINGIFQFMFIDCWPSITWSVVDYYGRKKKGFFALQENYQPLFISIGLRQKKYFPGSPLIIHLWIINDTYTDYKNVHLSVEVMKNAIWRSKKMSFLSDSIKNLTFKEVKIVLDYQIPIGEHVVSISVQNKAGKVLSKSKFNIVIVRNPLN